MEGRMHWSRQGREFLDYMNETRLIAKVARHTLCPQGPVRLRCQHARYVRNRVAQRADDRLPAGQDLPRLRIALRRTVRLGIRFGYEMRSPRVANVSTRKVIFRGWHARVGGVRADSVDAFEGGALADCVDRRTLILLSELGFALSLNDWR